MQIWPSTCMFTCFNMWTRWLNSDETWVKCYATAERSRFFIVKFQTITQKHGKFKNWRWKSHSDHGVTSYGRWERQHWRLPTLCLFHFPLAPLGLCQIASSWSELIHGISFYGLHMYQFQNPGTVVTNKNKRNKSNWRH